MSELARQVVDGDRRALARAITLVESTRADHRAEAEALLAEVLPAVGGAVRVGISGAPGAGKSTFIEALGTHLVAHDHRVAVLAVDPSSTRSGGSILGDKTRMEELTRSPHAFVRPSPTGGTLGGVARRTREALLLCEAAGFDVVLVAPGGGDALQGLKRGIMELADLVVVNKADGELASVAAHTAADYSAALHLVRPRLQGWIPRVLTCSALTGSGIPEVWDTVAEFRTAIAAELSGLRAGQNREWMWSEVTDSLLDALTADATTAALARRLEAEVAAGTTTPTAAARAVVAAHLGARSAAE